MTEQDMIIMYQSFVTTAHPPTPWRRVGDSRAKVRGNHFSFLFFYRSPLFIHSSFKLLFKCPCSAGDMTEFLLYDPYPRGFSIEKCRAKSKVLTSSLPPGGGAHSRALKLKCHSPGSSGYK